MELILCIAVIWLAKSCQCDFFSDLDKLDIDTQLREIDEMIEKLDDDNGVFDNVFDTVDDLVSGDCIYRCKKGAKPLPRKGHVPTSNGCGSFGLQLDTSALPQMTKCCDAHDHCYDTCNQDRDQCDNDFKTCLDVMCVKLKPDITKNQFEGCKETAKLIYAGTTALGCSPYLSAQERACQCSAEESGSRSPTKTSRQDQQRENKQRETQTKSGSRTVKKESDQKEKDKTRSQKESSETRTKDKKMRSNQNPKQGIKSDKTRLNDEL